jgi:Fic family protein
MGRLLIILYLVREKALALPLLYMSDYFEKNREAYYSHLLDVSKNSTYSDWLKFFLTGVVYQAKLVIDKINKLSDYYKEKGDSLGKYSKPTYMLFQQLFASYFTTVQRASLLIGVTYPTAKKALENLIKEGVLSPVGFGKTRNQLFVAEKIREIYKT